VLSSVPNISIQLNVSWIPSALVPHPLRFPWPFLYPDRNTSPCFFFRHRVKPLRGVFFPHIVFPRSFWYKGKPAFFFLRRGLSTLVPRLFLFPPISNKGTTFLSCSRILFIFERPPQLLSFPTRHKSATEMTDLFPHILPVFPSFFFPTQCGAVISIFPPSPRLPSL